MPRRGKALNRTAPVKMRKVIGALQLVHVLPHHVAWRVHEVHAAFVSSFTPRLMRSG